MKTAKGIRSREPMVVRVLRSGRTRRIAQLRIWAPIQRSEGEWVTEYSVSPMRRRRRAIGLDGFQSLIIAIDAVRRHIMEADCTLTWEGGESGDAGVPMIIPASLGLANARHLENIIESEVRAICKNPRVLRGT